MSVTDEPTWMRWAVASAVHDAQLAIAPHARGSAGPIAERPLAQRTGDGSDGKSIYCNALKKRVCMECTRPFHFCFLFVGAQDIDFCRQAALRWPIAVPNAQSLAYGYPSVANALHVEHGNPRRETFDSCRRDPDILGRFLAAGRHATNRVETE